MLTASQVDSAINHLNFLQFSEAKAPAQQQQAAELPGDERAVNFNTIGAVQAMTAGGLNDPMNAALFAGQSMDDVLKYQAFSQGRLD